MQHQLALRHLKIGFPKARKQNHPVRINQASKEAVLKAQMQHHLTRLLLPRMKIFQINQIDARMLKKHLQLLIFKQQRHKVLPQPHKLAMRQKGMTKAQNQHLLLQKYHQRGVVAQIL